MRQGDGSDFLDAGDPRSSEIGIIYVESMDSRQEILTEINILNMQGRKQIVLVLSEERKIFLQPVDFDGLKQARRDLKAQLILIAPSGSGPAEFARQRRFPVYSSLESLKHDQTGGDAQSGTEQTSTPQSGTKRPGLLAFGSRRTKPRGKRGPATSSPPPSLDQPTPRVPAVPPTPDFPAVPPTPRQPGQRPARRNTKEMDASKLAGAAGLAAGFAARGQSDDDDALYTPPANQQGAQPDGSAGQQGTGAMPPIPPTPRVGTSARPHESKPGPSIIAFPGTPQTPRTSGKIPPAQDKGGSQPSPTQAQGKTSGSLVASQGSSNRPSRKLSTPPGKPSGTLPATQGTQDKPDGQPPAAQGQGASATGSGKLATTSTAQQNVPGTQKSPTPTRSGTGKIAALGAGAALAAGAAAAGASANPATPGAAGPGTPRTASPAALSAGSPAGPGAGAHPSGLTPLPPPRPSRNRRSIWRRVLLGVLILLILGLIAGFYVNAQGGFSKVLPGNLSATVTITPASHLVQNNYIITGVPGGTTDTAKRQITARLLTQTSPTKTATGHATGSIPARQASGTLTFVNSTGSGITLGTTVLSGKNGVQVRFNGPVFVPALSSSTPVNAVAVNSGAAGNIPALDIAQSCCASGIGVKNPSPFTGGQDGVPNSIIQQRDIDGAANPLVTSLSESTRTALQKDVKSNERVVNGSFQCKSQVTHDHNVGDEAQTVNVSVSVNCTEEVYDMAAALQMARSFLQQQAQTDPALGSQYALDGQIVTSVLADSVTSAENQVNLEVNARGLWVYQFNDQLQHNMRQSLISLPKTQALNVLQHQMGVSAAKIEISSGSIMPDNASNIALVIQQLPGAQVTSTPGPGTPNPASSPTSLPASPTPTTGLGGS
ncbi:MAG TPA: hypothetical protein VFV38_40780 [Ktedonobacteraceae bacterium]|nr:hypothetical protein [Ktedonobacteraceae bacterium]